VTRQQINPRQLEARIDDIDEREGHAHAAVLGQWCEQAVRLAYHITRDREAALDLSQEAVIKAMNALPSHDGAGIGKAWFMRIVVNVCRDWLRHQAVERRARDDCKSVVVLPPSFDPADGLQRRELLERTRRAMLDLPLDYREALALVAVEGFSTREAAIALNVPEGTLRWRLSEARAMVKAELQRQDNM